MSNRDKEPPSGLPMVTGMRFKDFVSVNSHQKKPEAGASHEKSPQPATHVEKDINSNHTLKRQTSPQADIKNHMNINEHMLER